MSLKRLEDEQSVLHDAARTVMQHTSAACPRREEDFNPWPPTCYRRSFQSQGNASLVRYIDGDYSVPTLRGNLQVLVRGYLNGVSLSCKAGPVVFECKY